MIQFFKRLFYAIFGKKKVDDISSTPAIYPDPAQIEEMVRRHADDLTKVKQLQESRRWLMRNNRILIQYNGKCMNTRNNGKVESMRCTSMKRAREIASGIASYCIKKIVFSDNTGQQFIIKSIN